MIQRRTFLAGWIGIAIAPRRATAQPSHNAVVGVLISGSNVSDFNDAFHQSLGDFGYVEGRNVRIEYRSAEGHYDRLPSLAAELIKHGASVIVAAGPPAALAAKAATATVPIVFIASDAVQLGLVNSLNRPGGNVTGVSILVTSLWPKRLELMSEIIPKPATIAILVNPRSKEEPTAADVEDTARTSGRTLLRVTAATEREIDLAFSTAVRQQARGLLVSPDPLFTGHSGQIVELATRHALPAMYGWRLHVANGGLISYGPSLSDGGYRVGAYTARILKGATPADLPVEQPTKFELVINMKTAKALGLTIPQSVLLRADQIIE